MPTEPILVQVDDEEHVATTAEKAQINAIRQDPGPATDA